MPPLAPRPFSQMARRDVRLYGNTLQGLRGALSAAPWYRRMRRRSAPAFLRRRARPCLLPARLYQRCEVA